MVNPMFSILFPPSPLSLLAWWIAIYSITTCMGNYPRVIDRIGNRPRTPKAGPDQNIAKAAR